MVSSAVRFAGLGRSSEAIATHVELDPPVETAPPVVGRTVRPPAAVVPPVEVLPPVEDTPPVDTDPPEGPGTGTQAWQIHAVAAVAVRVAGVPEP